MNKKQQIVLGLGLLLIVLNGLFPPFEAEIRGTEKDWPTSTRYLGYHILFSPPSQADVLGKDWMKTMSDIMVNGRDEETKNAAIDQLAKGLDSVRVHIAMSYFIVQIVTVVSLTTGACFMFRRSSGASGSKNFLNICN